MSSEAHKLNSLLSSQESRPASNDMNITDSYTQNEMEEEVDLAEGVEIEENRGMKRKATDGLNNPRLKSPVWKESVFSQEVARKELAAMIVLHEYPLSIVEHMGFRRFVAALQPLFKMVSRDNIKKDILNLFEVERNKAKLVVDSHEGRIAITTDMWTSDNQNRGYMAVTAHFIDNSWTIRSFLVRFIYVPAPYTADKLRDVLFDCLLEWNIDRKLSTLTLDNCSTNDALINGLLSKLSAQHLMLNGNLLHVRCFAQVLNLIVKDGLEVIGDGIERIRNSVAYWTSSPKREELFEATVHQLRIDFSRKLALDCKSRWNSTFIMLNIALSYKEVFDRLKLRDPDFTCAPNDDGWKFAKDICDRLKIFYDATELFSGTNFVTANHYFAKICSIKVKMRQWLAYEDPVIQEMTRRMCEKFDKYWHDVHSLMAVASVLDPRYKLMLCEYFYIELFGHGEVAQTRVSTVRQLCYELVSEYQTKFGQGSTSEGVATSQSSLVVSHNDDLSDFDLYVTSFDSTYNSSKSELDRYLDEPVLKRTNDFDILSWWKVSGWRYPTLMRIARDVLAIPISTVASKSAFSTSGRILSPHRSQLLPSTLEALMCAQNWLLAENKGSLMSVFGLLTCLEELGEHEGQSSKF